MPGGWRKGLALGLAALLVIAGGYFAYSTLFAGEGLAFGGINQADDADDEGSDADAGQDPEPLYSVGEITTDLRRGEDGILQFVQADMRLACGDDETYAEIERRHSAVRDSLLQLFRSLTAEQLRGEEGMKMVREEIIRIVNEIVDPFEIVDVFFTELLVQ